MKYLRKFQDHTEYEVFANSEDMLRPNVSHCVLENDVHYNKVIHDYSKDYFTIESLEDDNMIYFKSENNAVIKTISASTDNGNTWTEYSSSTEDEGTVIATLNQSKQLLIKGNNSTYCSTSGIIYTNGFNSEKNFIVKGNIMSLIASDSFETETTFTGSGNLQNLFGGCTTLVSAENLILPVTALTSYCYMDMFNGCTSLTTAPQLPATTLINQCYYRMFVGCTSLVAAPELPATQMEENSYANMFQGCTSLITAPELPATGLAPGCYSYMFSGCTNLTTAPELSCTVLSTNCYFGMFKGCRSLTTAPDLPALGLYNYCYSNMFSGCTSLNYIKAMFTTTPSNTYTQNWVSGVAASGTFVKNSAAQWNVTGANGVPNGWTVQTASS